MPLRQTARTALLSRAAIVLFSSAFAAAAQGAEDFSPEAGALLDRYCVSCHRGEKPKAGLTLASARDPDSLQRNRKKWESVSRMLGHREMPPKKAKQPTEKERLALREAVDAELDLSLIHI